MTLTTLGYPRAPTLRRIDACNYDGTSLGLNVVNPSTNHSQKLRSSLPSQLTGSNHGQWSTLSRDPGQVLIDDQLAKQLGVTTRTDDQISRPSVTPIKDSIGYHPPKKFSSYVTWCDNSRRTVVEVYLQSPWPWSLSQEVRQVGNGGKRLTKRWDCPETDYADVSPQSQPLPSQRWAQQTTVSSSGATPSLVTLNANLWIQGGQLKTRPNQSSNTWTNALLSLHLSKPWNNGTSLSLIRPDSGDP
ncbi:hypothetical protein BY996DRAFT_6408662 [Phakopsora pachyrhizi]|nr:hypothetical protein BY996DRAFT_6408662 [Phakopsora pachyrhizi]